MLLLSRSSLFVLRFRIIVMTRFDPYEYELMIVMNRIIRIFVNEGD